MPAPGEACDDLTLDEMAHHEAGHAVVCLLLYGEEVIKSIEIGSGQEAHGKVSCYSRLPVPLTCRPPVGEPRRGNPAPVSAEAIVDAHGVLSYAGIAAEQLLREGGPAPGGRDEPPRLDSGQEARGLVDREALSTLASTVGASRSADHFFVEYWNEAMRLLRAHWHAVELLAEQLKDRRTLNGDRADGLLRGVIMR